jgi:predicted MPP superfamily phosphohydrolase
VLRPIAILIVSLLFAAGAWPGAQEALRAQRGDALRFAVIGDFGTGDAAQYDVGKQMALAHERTPFDLVLALGDNMYGRQQPADFVKKFEQPYAPLLAGGVPFYATLGNHDSPDNRNYPPFHMNGERYYTYTRGPVRFVVLDTNVMDGRQVEWAGATLGDAREPWKIVYFHHPIYSSGGRHGSNVELRVLLEPLLTRAGVNVVFSGHDHHYERFLPQKGITYFVEGSSGKLRKGFDKSELTAAIYDGDNTFMVVEVAGETLSFQTISRAGRTIDSGTVRRRPTT